MNHTGQSHLSPELDSVGRLGPVMGGDTDAAVSLRIVLDDQRSDGARGDGTLPVLDDSDPDARVFHAAAVTRHGTCLAQYALSVQRSDRTDVVMPDGSAARSNAQIDRMWIEALTAEPLRGESQRAASALVEIWTMCARNADGTPQKLPPLWYCKLRQRLFRPRCPDTLQPLVDCRDEALLAANGLPGFAGSGFRFVYAPDAAPAVFYATLNQPPAGAGQVKSEDDVVAGLGRIVARKGELSKTDALQHARLVAELPCYDCPHASECYPGEGRYTQALERLTPFSFYEYYATCSRLGHLDFESAVDLLGGRPASELADQFRRAAPGGSGVRQRQYLRAMEQLEEFPRRLLFQDDPHGRDALEVLRLKATLIFHVVSGLRETYRAELGPHLGVCPANVWIGLDPGAAELPVWWNLRARLGEAGTTLRTVLTIGGAADVFHRPRREAPAVYLSPRLAKGLLAFGRSRTGRAVFRSVETQPAAAGHTLVTMDLDLHDDGFDWSSACASDAVRIMLPPSLARGVPALWGRPGLAHADGAAAGVGAVLVRQAAPESSTAALRGLAGTELGRVEYAVYPKFGLSPDLYAVGVLLWRACLVNDGNGLPGLLEDARTRAAGQSGAPAEAAVRGLIEGRGGEGPWGRRNVFHRRQDRDPGRPNAIPSDLWEDLIALGFRLTQPGGASAYCDEGELPTGEALAKLDRVMIDLRVIIERIDTELFDRSVRNQEVCAVVRELLAELPEKSSAAG